MIQHFGAAMLKGGQALCGATRESQYEVEQKKDVPRGLAVAPKRRDWRSYLCCKLTAHQGLAQMSSLGI